MFNSSYVVFSPCGAKKQHTMQIYRTDPAALVAAAAQFTFPPDER
jgi:hypothetical protein